MKIRKISSKETLALRNEVLRPGKDLSACVFEGDEAPRTQHFGALDDEENIVGIVSVYYKECPSLQLQNAYQLRSMATSPRCRGKGIGRLLLETVEDFVKAEEVPAIWANARSSALGFYLNAGYKQVSDEFMIEEVGPHYLVTKAFSPLCIQ